MPFGVVRDYVETCLRTPGQQYSRALQDLLNHAGQLIGFNVEFGRYSGVANEIGYDGIWRSGELAVVVEIKTTDAYTIDTSTLVGYVDRLIGAGRIGDWDNALGLYILGRTAAPAITQLEHSIVGQKRSHQLRVATVESILSLAELRQDSVISLDEALALVKPLTVRVDDIVRILARVAVPQTEMTTRSEIVSLDQQTVLVEPPSSRLLDHSTPVIALVHARDDHLYLLTPVADDDKRSAKDTIRQLLDTGWYVFGDRTTGRKALKPGDRIAFYESGVGVVAEAEVDSRAEERELPNLRYPERYRWAFRVKNARYFFEEPVVIDVALRAKLDAFRERDPEGSWSWLVQGTRKLTAHDFAILTGSREEP